MTVLYRAVWAADVAEDDAEETVISSSRHAIAAWAQEAQEPEPLVEGSVELEISQGRRRRVTYRPLSELSFEVIIDDHTPEITTEWTTVIRTIATEGRVHTLIENRMNSDDFELRVSVGRPRIVHDLLEQSAKPRLGGSGVLTETQEIPAEAVQVLADTLADAKRTLPVIVCTEPVGAHDGSWTSTAARIASRTEGVAVVITLDQRAVAAFRAILGDLAIWGGGIRVYAPGAVTADSDGWRHRYYLRSRVEEALHATINRVVYSVAQLSARRRVPDVFRAFDAPTSARLHQALDSISLAEFKDELEKWEFAHDLALEERSEVEKELSRANGHLSRLKDELSSRGLSDLLWGTQHEVGTSVPHVVQDTSEAVLSAQTYLSAWLSLPDSAARELADIDTAPTAFAWGNNAWRGLRALAAYAEDRAGGWDKGGFWEWCASGPVLGWPATSKKLSMSESESVQNSDKLSRTRRFKVDSAVSGSGEIMMLAHMKISEGGGNLAPRIYFYDDTSGSTGKVHVGLIGPHYLVPNKSTN